MYSKRDAIRFRVGAHAAPVRAKSHAWRRFWLSQEERLERLTRQGARVWGTGSLRMRGTIPPAEGWRGHGHTGPLHRSAGTILRRSLPSAFITKIPGPSSVWSRKQIRSPSDDHAAKLSEPVVKGACWPLSIVNVKRPRPSSSAHRAGRERSWWNRIHGQPDVGDVRILQQPSPGHHGQGLTRIRRTHPPVKPRSLSTPIVSMKVTR